jgi:protein associated with RNAse G/E
MSMHLCQVITASRGRQWMTLVSINILFRADNNKNAVPKIGSDGNTLYPEIA